MSIKIAIVGAGSIGFTRSMLRDILSVPELQDSEVALTDIHPKNLEAVAALVRRDLDHNKVPTRLAATTDRRTAIEGADYVLSFVRVGGLEAFQTDVEIPLGYGVDQCVGDTLGPGGVFYAQRGIPVLLDFCKDIREVAAEGALFLNYSNPMAMLTWACNEYGDVPTVGLCHGVQGGHWQLAQVIELIARDRGWIAPDATIAKKDVEIICAGINHQTWYIQVRFQGQDMLPYLLEGFERHPVFSRTEKVRIDVLRRFGYYSTESNGHLSEYVPWYRKRPDDLLNWIDLGSWIDGETGGYLRVCTEGRRWFEHDFPRWLQEPPTPYGPEHRGEEHGSYIIEALETGRRYRGHFNVVNSGIIHNLPPDAIVEAPGYVDGNGISMPVVGDLPLGCAAVCNASISVQRLGVEAAVQGDIQLLRQAVLLDPLTSAVCNPPEVWEMVDAMLVAQAQWLPQFADEIEPARARLKQCPRLARFPGYRGAARLETKSIEQMEADRAASTKNAAAADKAGPKEVSGSPA
jgi:alpha-galactosidase